MNPKTNNKFHLKIFIIKQKNYINYNKLNKKIKVTNKYKYYNNYSSIININFLQVTNQ